MATANKILGQSVPAANTAAVVYTAPAVTQADGKLFVCNTSDKAARIWVAITKSGNTLAAKDYIYSDFTLGTRDTMKIEGLCLAAGDFVNVKSSKAGTVFNLVGFETA